jgi:hypothetical protein
LDFIQTNMRMAHIYQPVMIRALIDYRGEAMRRGRELGQPGTHFRYQKFQAAGAVLALLCLAPAPAHPTNGLSAIGFGAESDAMAGADIAVARDTATMNLNPAGITQIPGNALDICGGIIYPLSVAHRDKLGNDLEVWNRRTYVGGAGFTHRIGDSPVTVGIGLFALPFGPGAKEENEYVALQLTLSCRW